VADSVAANERLPPFTSAPGSGVTKAKKAEGRERQLPSAQQVKGRKTASRKIFFHQS